MPNGTTIVGFADDISIDLGGKRVRKIEEKTNIAFQKLEHGLIRQV